MGTDIDRGGKWGSAVKVRNTYSLCPVCLKKTEAALVRPGGSEGLWMVKTCGEHGEFRTKVWAGRINYEEWVSGEEPLTVSESGRCSGDCRTCEEGSHGQDTCCVILEVTRQCNLRCTYCFVHGGETEEQPSFDELRKAIDVIAEKGGGPLIQFSGGEPTLREDLPELVRYARQAGCRYTQINTNGIRLAEDEDYVRKLADAGLDIVFLQFDGTKDEIYRYLRGRELLDIKLQAIRNCDQYRIGVTLVPTIVSGINTRESGSIVRMAAELFPAVRAVHFQPVTYLGRYPQRTQGHYTLDELMADLCIQTGIPESAFLPSRCDHAMCEFHATFLVNSRGQLVPVSDRFQDMRRARTCAARNRQYVAEHWRRNDTERAGNIAAGPAGLPLVCPEREEMDLDEFVHCMKTRTFKISAMAFQDAANIDLERLHRCSLHVYEEGRLLPFCGKYLTDSNKTDGIKGGG